MATNRSRLAKPSTWGWGALHVVSEHSGTIRHYASQDGRAWSIEGLDGAPGQSGQELEIAVAGNGRAYIAYPTDDDVLATYQAQTRMP